MKKTIILTKTEAWIIVEIIKPRFPLSVLVRLMESKIKFKNGKQTNKKTKPPPGTHGPEGDSCSKKNVTGMRAA